jgi:hypothetical protein
MRKLKLALVGKAKQPRASKNLTHTVVLVSDNNQKKNALMDSEIFWGEFLDEFPFYANFSVIRPPILPF